MSGRASMLPVGERVIPVRRNTEPVKYVYPDRSSASNSRPHESEGKQ